MKNNCVIQARELHYWINQQTKVSRPLYLWSNENIKSLIHYITIGSDDDAKFLYMLFANGEDQYWFVNTFKPNVNIDKQLFILDFIHSYVDKIGDIEIVLLEKLFELRFIYPFCTHPLFAMLTEERFKQRFLNEETYEILNEDLRQKVYQQYLFYDDSTSIHISRGWDALFGFGDITLQNQLKDIAKNANKADQKTMLQKFCNYVNSANLSQFIQADENHSFKRYVISMTKKPFKNHLLLCLNLLKSTDYSGILGTIADGFNAYDDDLTSCAEGMNDRFIDFAKTLMLEEQYLNECGKLRLLENSFLSADMLNTIRKQCASIILKDPMINCASWDDENVHDVELAEQCAISALQQSTENKLMSYIYSYYLTRSFENSWCSFVLEFEDNDESITLKLLSDKLTKSISTSLQASNVLTIQKINDNPAAVSHQFSSDIIQVTENMNPMDVRILGKKKDYLDYNMLSNDSTQLYFLSDETIRGIDNTLWVKIINNASLLTIKKMTDDFIISRNNRVGALIIKLAENMRLYNDDTKKQVIGVLINHMTNPVLKSINEYRVNETILISVEHKKRRLNIKEGKQFLRPILDAISSESAISNNYKLFRQYLKYDSLEQLLSIFSQQSVITSDALVISRLVNSSEQNILHLALTEMSHKIDIGILENIISWFHNNHQKKRVEWLLESIDEDGLSVTHEAARLNRDDVLELYDKYLPQQYILKLFLQNDTVNNQSTFLLALKNNSLAFIRKMMSYQSIATNTEWVKSIFDHEVIEELVQLRSKDNLKFAHDVLDTINEELLAQLIINEPNRWLGPAIMQKNWAILDLFITKMKPSSRRLCSMLIHFDRKNRRSIAYYMSADDLLQFVTYDVQSKYSYTFIMYLGLSYYIKYKDVIVPAINLNSKEFFVDCLRLTLHEKNTNLFRSLYQTQFAKDYLDISFDLILNAQSFNVLQSCTKTIIEYTPQNELGTLLMKLTNIHSRILKFFVYHFIEINDIKTALLLAKKYASVQWVMLFEKELINYLLIRSTRRNDADLSARRSICEDNKNDVAEGFYDSNEPELITEFYKNTLRLSSLNLPSRLVKMCVDHDNVNLLQNLLIHDRTITNHLIQVPKIGLIGIAHYAAREAKTNIIQLLIDNNCTNALSLKIRENWFWEYTNEETQRWIDGNKSCQKFINNVKENQSSKRRLDDLSYSTPSAKKPRF